MKKNVILSFIASGLKLEDVMLDFQKKEVAQVVMHLWRQCICLRREYSTGH